MQFRGLLVAAVLLAVLGGGLWWSNKAELAKEGKPDPTAAPKIIEIPADQIQDISVTKGGETTTIHRGKDNKWEITAPKAFRADQDAAAALATTFASLPSDRLIEEKAADVSAYGLASPAFTVTIGKKDGKNVKLLVGDDSPTGSNAFVKLEGDPRVFTLASFNKTSLDKGFKDLEDKRLLTFDNEKLTRLELTLKGQTIELGKDAQNEWQIVRPKPLRADGGQVEELVRKLRDAKKDITLSEEDIKKLPATFASATVAGTVKVTDNTGTQQVEIRKDKDNNYYAKSSVLDGVVKAPTDLGDAVNKSIDDLRNKKLFDFGFNEPSKVVFRDGPKTRTIEKKDEKWMEGSTQMDSTSVQNLIDKLRDLSATKFPDTGFTVPEVEASVTWSGGKRTEKVQLSKTGDRWIGKRENEPSLYEVDKAAVEDMQRTAGDVKAPAPPAAKDSQKK